MVRALKRALAVLAVTAAGGLLLAGCGGERLRDLYYDLQPQVSLSPAPRPVPGILRVSPLAARGFAGGTRIVYRTQQQPLRVQRYDELLWESPPASAIADALVAALRAGRVFEHVIVAGDPARADFLLSGELTRFEHRPTDQPPGVSVEFSLALIQARGRGLLASNNYVGFEPTVNGADGRTTPEAMVAAFDRVTGRLIEQAIRDVQALPPERFR